MALFGPREIMRSEQIKRSDERSDSNASERSADETLRYRESNNVMSDTAPRPHDLIDAEIETRRRLSEVQKLLDLSHALHGLDQEIRRLHVLRDAAYAEYVRMEADQS